MSDEDQPLTQAFDVGGQRFLLSTDRSIDLGYKGRIEFTAIFGAISKSTNIPLNRIIYLLSKYLPYPVKGPYKFIFPLGSRDRQDLLDIITARIDQIKETEIHTLKQVSLLYIREKLEKIVDQIKTDSRVDKPYKKRKELTDNEKFSLILEFSWYLMHPNEEMNEEWEAMIKKLDTKSLDALVHEIQVEEEKQGVDPNAHKTALNYFQNIDLKDVIHQSTKNQAMKRIKNMVLFPGSETGKELKTRLKNLMMILTMKGFIEEPLEYRESIPVIKNSDLYEAKFQMPRKLIKGGYPTVSTSAADKEESKEEKKKDSSPTKEIAISLGKAMTPFFDYFKEMYDPIYGFITKAMEAFHKDNPTIPSEKVMHELLSLLYVCSHLPSSDDKVVPKGVYRIQNIDAIALNFISFMLKYTQKEKIQDKTQEEKDEFLGHLFKLPIFRLSTYKGKSISKAYTDPSTLPYVQFMMMGHNLILKDDSNFAMQPSGLVKRYEAIQPFFQDRAIYLVVSDSNLSKDSLTPLTLFDIDYRSIQLDKALVDVNPVEDISTTMENGQKMMLEQVMNINDSTFNHGELIMCILQILKKQMPQ